MHRSNIHGPCRRFRGYQNDEDTRTFCGKFLYNAIASTDNAQHKKCPSSGIDDRPGRDLFRVLKRSPISQPHTPGLRRGYSDGKAVGNTTGLRRRLRPHWRISLLQSLCNYIATQGQRQRFLLKYVLSTMGVSKKSISKFLIGNRFHVKLRIHSPYSNRCRFLLVNCFFSNNRISFTLNILKPFHPSI